MKRNLILFALMCMMSASTFAVEAAKCVLQHKGSVKMYDASAIADAIKDAVDGDTLFLTAGSFGGFTLDKQVTVRGAGESTKITGDITVNIPGTPTLSQTLLEGLNSNSQFCLNSAMSNVIIRQCSFYNLSIFTQKVSNITIDRCCINSSLYLTNKIEGLNVINIKIKSIDNSYNSNYYPIQSNVCNFLNCNIYSIYQYTSGYVKGSFINCIIYNFSNNITFNDCSFVNTLHHANYTLSASSFEQQCYYDANMTVSSSSMECGYDSATLQSNGYLGNDGTVVGIYGGTNPYTLDLAIPKVTSSTISLDNEKKLLNVSLKVTAK